MKRRTMTRKMTMLLACCMMFSGCGKKNVDYNVDGGSGTDSGSIRSDYAIPETIDQEIDTGASDLKKIQIKVDDITVPDVGTMYTEKLRKLDTAEKRKQEIVESVFDKDAGIYDCDVVIKSEIQEELDGYLSLKQDATAEDKLLYEEKIESLREELENAPEDYPAATDYTTNGYIGTMDGREYRLRFPGAEESVASDTYFQITENMLSYRPIDDDEATSAYCESLDSYNEYNDTKADDTNACTLTEAAASDQAEAFLRKLGVSGLTEQSVSSLCWEYYNESGNVIATEVDGYQFTYRRMIDNLSLSDVEIQNANNLNSSLTDLSADTAEDTFSKGYAMIYPEYCKVDIDANGIVKATWLIYLDEDSEPEKTGLLSFDELSDRANETIPAYYETYPTVGYDEITFNNMELTYYLKQGDTEDIFEITPVWVLTETETYEESDYEDIRQVVILDAVTGEAIDLWKLADALDMIEPFDEPPAE